MKQIAIADKDGNLSLWCNVKSTLKNGAIRFYVINGMWYGSILGDKVYVEETKHTYGGNYIVWQGKASFDEHSYNEAMAWIRTQIDPSAKPPRIRDYIFNTTKYNEDEYDEYKAFNDKYADLWKDDIPF